MKDQPQSPWRSSGFVRLVRAARHQGDGIRQGLLHDPAIRQVSLACFALCVAAALLPVSKIEKLILVLSALQIVLVEYLNSAIEATVDRISLEAHPLSKHAKDFASVAVAIAVMMSMVSWAVIAGPLLIQWLRGH